MKRTTLYKFTKKELLNVLHRELIHMKVISRSEPDPIQIRINRRNINELEVIYKDDSFDAETEIE